MQSTDYSCGPAALATVLQNMGINVTEQELKVLAGTDVSGTSMHGLAQAARSKGLNATGMRLSIDELRPDMIVHVINDGTPHYSVIKEVTNESVRLADPSLGNIEMTREKFNEIYTGNALVISDPNMQVNTTNQTGSVQAENQTLTDETMQSIRRRVIWKVVGVIVVAAIICALKWAEITLAGWVVKTAISDWLRGLCINPFCTRRSIQPYSLNYRMFCRRCL